MRARDSPKKYMRAIEPDIRQVDVPAFNMGRGGYYDAGRGRS